HQVIERTACQRSLKREPCSYLIGARSVRDRGPPHRERSGLRVFCWTAARRCAIRAEVLDGIADRIPFPGSTRIVTGAPDYKSEAGGTTSVSLLERVKAHDQQAWERLVSLYAPLVERWCRRASLQQADLADVRQEVFLAVARSVADFRRDRPGDTFRGWLRGITRNKVNDHWRKVQARLPEAPAGDHLGQQALDEPEPAEASEEVHGLYRRALELVRRDFEEPTWQAFWRIVVDGQAPAAVAADLQTTLNAVYLAKGRVLRRLREEFQDLIEH